LDLSLPEPDAVGQPVSITRAGKQFEEEVGILFIEGSQSLGDDLERSLVRVGLPGCRWRWSGFEGRSRWGAHGNRKSGRRGRTSCCFEKLPQILSHVQSRVVSLGCSLRECFQTNAFQFLGYPVVDLPGWANFCRGDNIQQFPAGFFFVL